MPTFGPGVGPILLYHVRCNGSERRLVDCPSGNDYYGSGHSTDAGVRCQFIQSTGIILSMWHGERNSNIITKWHMHSFTP